MSTSADNLIGKGIVFPLNLNEQGTVQLDGGFDLLRASLRNILAFTIGNRYFLGEFGASPEDLLESPNDDVTAAVIKHRLESQVPYWDPRIQVDLLKVERDNDFTVNVVLNVSLKGTDLSEIFVIPFTVNTVQ